MLRTHHLSTSSLITRHGAGTASLESGILTEDKWSWWKCAAAWAAVKQCYGLVRGIEGRVGWGGRVKRGRRDHIKQDKPQKRKSCGKLFAYTKGLYVWHKIQHFRVTLLNLPLSPPHTDICPYILHFLVDSLTNEYAYSRPLEWCITHYKGLIMHLKHSLGEGRFPERRFESLSGCAEGCICLTDKCWISIEHAISTDAPNRLKINQNLRGS